MKITNKNIETTFQAGQTLYAVSVPAGLRVTEIDRGSTKGKFFLDQFPPHIFPTGSMMLHDAQHYGIVIEPQDVSPLR